MYPSSIVIGHNNVILKRCNTAGGLFKARDKFQICKSKTCLTHKTWKRLKRKSLILKTNKAES